MQLEKAVKQAKELEEIKKSQERDGFFCSALTTLKEEEEIEKWQLGFYLPESEVITTIEVTDESCQITNSDKPLKQDLSQLKAEQAEISAEKALKEAKNSLKENYGGYYNKIILSLKNEENELVWSVAFVRQNMTIVSFEVDSKSGEVVSSEEKQMFEKR